MVKLRKKEQEYNFLLHEQLVNWIDRNIDKKTIVPLPQEVIELQNKIEGFEFDSNTSIYLTLKSDYNDVWTELSSLVKNNNQEIIVENKTIAGKFKLVDEIRGFIS